MPNKPTEQLIEEAVKEFEANFIEKDYLNPEDGLVIKNEPEEILKYFETSIRTIATKSAEEERRAIMREAGAVFVNWDESKKE